MDVPLNQPLPDPHEQTRLDRGRFLRALLLSAGFITVLWWIKLVETWLGVSFSALGIFPKAATGLVGILTAPLLHGSVGHLINNTLPLLVLGTLMLSIYPRAALRSILLVWLGSGLVVWIIGRLSYHLGASGLSHGLMFFLFIAGALRRDRPAIAAAMIAFFLYGGMLLTILPGEPEVSWEAHMGGAFFGALAAALFFRLDPAPAGKRYSWEDDEHEADALEEALAAEERGMYEPPPPEGVPVLWVRPEASTGHGAGADVIPFPPRRPASPDPPAQ